MKVAVNKCYGGFGISNIALKELVIRKANCIKVFTPKSYHGGENKNKNIREEWKRRWKEEFAEYIDIGDGFMAHNCGFNLYRDGLIYKLNDRSDIEVRTDKDLIEVIEKLGDRASDRFANIEITEIPDGVIFEIEEHDGMESVHEKHRSW